MLRNALRGDHTVEVCRGRLEKLPRVLDVWALLPIGPKGMVHDTILGLSGSWIVIFSGRGRQLVVLMGCMPLVWGKHRVSTGCWFTREALSVSSRSNRPRGTRASSLFGRDGVSKLCGAFLARGATGSSHSVGCGCKGMSKETTTWLSCVAGDT